MLTGSGGTSTYLAGPGDDRVEFWVLRFETRDAATSARFSTQYVERVQGDAVLMADVECPRQVLEDDPGYALDVLRGLTVAG